MSPDTTEVRIDLHVHSVASNRPFSWFMQSFDAGECYTEPDRAYELAMARGMTLVTLTDHDTIDGAITLTERYDNTFISEEISARFPEDGCVVHAIALHITPEQHEEIQRLRRDIYQLAQYMDEQKITFFWCHPLSDVNHRLTRTHLEQCLMMFRALEYRNGTRDRAHEEQLDAIVARVDPAQAAMWARKYPHVPFLNRSGTYARVGGSDDHGALAIARAFTSYRGDADADALCRAIARQRTEPRGVHGTADALSHNAYGVVAGCLRYKGQLGGGGAVHDTGAGASGISPSLLHALAGRKALIDRAGHKLPLDDLLAESHTDAFQQQLQAAISAALVGGWRTAFADIAAALGSAKLAEAADAVSEMVKSLLIELPYILAGRYFANDRLQALHFGQELCGTGAPQSPRIAIFSDTLDDVNGVAIGLRRLAREARRWGIELDLVGASAQDAPSVDGEGIVRLPAIFRHRLAEYPTMEWAIPHLPSLMRYLSDAKIDLVQCSTPGPVGLAALLAGRLMGLPVVGQYHTDVPSYVHHLTGDPTATTIARQIVGWFYRAVDDVLVPSDWVARVVREMGVAPARVRKIPRGINLRRFRPSHRDRRTFASYGVSAGPVLLCVGRLSREKSLDLVLAAFAKAAALVPDAQLALVGDGPMRDEIERRRLERVHVLGEITGTQLTRLYATADLFICLSETETFGNVVVEAQASGTPVVVAAGAATSEHIHPGLTGVTCDPHNPEETGRALAKLLGNPEALARMGETAARFARRYNMTEALRGTVRIYVELLQRPEARMLRRKVA